MAVSLSSILLPAVGGMPDVASPASGQGRVKGAGTRHMQGRVADLYSTDYAQLTSGQADTTLTDGVLIRALWTVHELVPSDLKRADVTVRTLSSAPPGYERVVRLFIMNRGRQ